LESGIIYKYFPDLTESQSEQLEQLGGLYAEWNSKINIISRKDIVNLYERHILHSLGIAKVIRFKPGTEVLDAGTGGGFPGVPLAILFPDAHFHLVDSTAKKLTVVRNIAEITGIRNVTAEPCRFEDHYSKYDFIISRAVAPLGLMVKSLRKNIKKNGFNEIENGMIYLKGGEFSEELGGMEEKRRGDKETGRRGEQFSLSPVCYTIYPLAAYFQEDFFETKSVVHLFF
jgi:16S rRNA (guanine527-N7)-methyltransferase